LQLEQLKKQQDEEPEEDEEADYRKEKKKKKSKKEPGKYESILLTKEKRKEKDKIDIENFPEPLTKKSSLIEETTLRRTESVDKSERQKKFSKTTEEPTSPKEKEVTSPKEPKELLSPRKKSKKNRKSEEEETVESPEPEPQQQQPQAVPEPTVTVPVTPPPVDPMKRKWFVKYQTGKTLTENKTPTESVESMYHTSQINNPTIPPPDTTLISPTSSLSKLQEPVISDSPKEEKKRSSWFSSARLTKNEKSELKAIADDSNLKRKKFRKIIFRNQKQNIEKKFARYNC